MIESLYFSNIYRNDKVIESEEIWLKKNQKLENSKSDQDNNRENKTLKYIIKSIYSGLLRDKE